MSANLEGRIDIHMRVHGGSVRDAAIRSSRPQLAQRLMAGLSPSAAAERAGLIFSLCGKAQRIAAEMACEAAQGQIPDTAELSARSRRVLIELAQEHAWHLLMNWPRQTGHAPDMAGLLALRQAAADPDHFGAVLRQLVAETLLGEPAESWLSRDLAAFDLWRAQARTLPAKLFGALPVAKDSGVSTTQLLPPLQQLDAAQCADLAHLALADEHFCAQPVWRGGPAETGAIARMHRHPLLADWVAARGRGAGARLLARLLELAQLPRQLVDGGDAVVKAYPLGENAGMSAIETSRGLLLHAVRLSAGKVTDYRIVAPTEWNFHPSGALAEALHELSDGASAAVDAESICQSLDPCVAFAVEVNDA